MLIQMRKLEHNNGNINCKQVNCFYCNKIKLNSNIYIRFNKNCPVVQTTFILFRFDKFLTIDLITC